MLQPKEWKKYKPWSLMMSLGYNAFWSEGAVKPPIFLTSTFAFPSAEHGEEFFKIAYGMKKSSKKHPPGLIYSRLNNPVLEILEDRLSIWEHAEDSAAFASGMAAISTLCFSLLNPGDTLVYSVPVYGGTDFLFNNILPKFDIKVIPIDAGSRFPERIRERKIQRAQMLFVETPANPNNRLTDLGEARKTADRLSTKKRPCYLVVDNTFLGPLFQQPLMLGADLTVYSATKFIGGHSDLIAGAILGSEELLTQIKAYRTIMGTMAPPFASWLMLRSLETLKIRMEQQAFTADVLASWLNKQPVVKKVYFPGLLENGDPQLEIFKRQCSGTGSLIAFEVKGGKKRAFKILNAVKLARLAVSLGGTESLIEHPMTMTHSDVDPATQKMVGITPGLIRISVGVENADDLIRDLKQAFRKAEG
ncbi:MAG: aminotransferase class I/II-fold pyridoxal phosphate-dependent enzyme [Planctomycetota bacterium]|jgi:methionine-gamma-lyase